jgi:hypothetical protein
VGCTACGGQRSVKSRGTGRVRCPKCRGGYNVCPGCKGKTTIDIPCQFCEGKGRIDCDVCAEKKDSPELQKMKTDRAENIKSLEGTTAGALMPYRLFDPPVFTQREDGLVVSFRYGIEVCPGGLAKENLMEPGRSILCALPRDGWLDVVKYVRFTCVKLKIEQDGTPKNDCALMVVTWKAEDLKKLDWNTNPAAADWLKAAFKKLLHPNVK